MRVMSDMITFWQCVAQLVKYLYNLRKSGKTTKGKQRVTIGPYKSGTGKASN